jgi:protein SCO1/2
VAALATALLGWRWRVSFPARSEWMVKRSLALFALATAANVFAGLALLVALPKPVLIRLVGGGTAWSAGLLAASLLLAVALAGTGLLALGARRWDAALLGVSAMLVATLVAMVLLRDELRRITLADAVLDPPPAAAPQWGALALFLALLAVGTATVGWMVRSLVSARAVVPLLALALLASGGCQRAPARPASGVSAQSAPGAPAHYPLKGRVVEVDRANRTVTVAHDDIEGFMPAMTMEFAVRQKDAVLLDHVDPGDEITATLAVADSRSWIESLVVVKKGEVAPDEVGGREVRPGEAIPDVALVDQDGHKLRLSDLAGRAYAVTFVYTRCPLPDYCPLMMKNFAAVEAALVADLRLRERTRLLTVSFDPENDTPAVLRRYGRPFQKTSPPFTHWTLATGEDAAIRALGVALGLDYEEQTGTFIHNLRTAVVDPRGRLVRVLHGNEWKAGELVDALRKAAASTSPAAPPA